MSGDASVAGGTVDCRLFDCLQVNLALLADRQHGPGTHLNLGAVLGFRPAEGPHGLPTVARSTRQQLAETAPRLGLAVLDRRTADGGELLPTPGRYVVADAFHLPWVPYFGQQHMEHSFLLEPGPAGAGVTVVDGYHNETRWGSARPVQRVLDHAAMAAAVPGPALAVTFGPGEYVRADEPVHDLADEGEMAGYVAAYAEHPDRAAALHALTLETWLLARSRALHVRFLQIRGLLGPDSAEGAAARAHVRAWESLAEATYLSSRRVERARPVNPRLYGLLADQLHCDRKLFGALGTMVNAPSSGAAGPVAGTIVPDLLREHVAVTVAMVLRVDPGALLGGRVLAEVPGFSSFRVVEIVERLERGLAVEFAPSDLVPENLHHLDGICRIVQRALPPGASPRLTRIGGF
ncbi:MULTISPECIES: hypothetical protein [unclassified Streptomyces]|uniref:hypothetical protein n=1 Tax=unclassified Streptomyces TaxID=2593676 RepID=UPI002E2A239E|nr:hypothetical protein [Streptomyces sp. NBC_01429]